MAKEAELRAGYDEMARKFAMLNQNHANNGALTIAACRMIVAALDKGNIEEARAHLNSVIDFWSGDTVAPN